jgi:hypothetical protein
MSADSEQMEAEDQDSEQMGSEQMEAEDQEESAPPAPLATQLGVAAAAFHWVSALLLVAGFVTSSGAHTAAWEAKYPEWEDRVRVMNNFSHADCAPMMLDQMQGMSQMQSWLVFEGIFESIACLLAICTIMCLKAHLNYRKPADEAELIAFTCMILGLVVSTPSYLPLLVAWGARC